MDLDRFRASPIGSLVDIEGYDALQQRRYRHAAFCPSPLSRELRLSQASFSVIAEAHGAIGRLDAAADRLPNPNLLVRPALTREAMSTSALEGTYAPLLEVLEADFVDASRQSQEVREIRNYISAAFRALDLIQIKPICRTVLGELQAILVKGTRGDLVDSGDLRTGQVYIGEQHRGIENSRFVPPPPGGVLVKGIDDWELWINSVDDVPLVAKAALGHYQFETLHPFSDGNGRLGRLVCMLQMMYEGALRHPILNLSPYFEPRKDEYKDLLLSTSATGDFDPWVQFFSRAVIAAAGDAENRIQSIISTRDSMLADLRRVRAKGVVLDIVDDFIAWPLLTISWAAKKHNVTYPPAKSAIKKLEQLGHVRELTGRSYGRVYACEAVMQAVDQPLGN